jgi:putative aldouronate transport system substrate-binding protein
MNFYILFKEELIMKKKNLQKVLALTLAGVMAAGTLTACGSSSSDSSSTDTSSSSSSSTSSSSTSTSTADTTTAAATDAVAGIDGWEPFENQVNLRLAVFDRSYEVDCQDNYWTNWVQENFGDKYNINVEYVGITRSDTPTAYALLAADQNLPTVIFEYDYDKLAGWVDDGYIQGYDLDEFKTIAPTYYQQMVDEDLISYTDYDGGTYFILGKRPYWNTTYSYVTFYRADWLEELGYDSYPTTYAELNELYQKLKDEGYCDYPLGGSKISGAGVDQNYAYRTYPQDELEWATTGTYQIPALGTDAQKLLLKRANEQYNLGYINPEFYIREASDNEADFVNGDCFTYSAYISSNMSVINSFYEQNPDGKLAIVYEDGLVVDEDGASNSYRPNNPFGAMLAFSNNATEDEIKAGMMYMEWLIQPENLTTMQWGIEGTTYDVVDGIPTLKSDFDSQYAQGFNSNVDYWAYVTATKSMGDIETDIKISIPQGLPDSDDFYDQVVKHYYGQLKIFDAGYAQADCFMPAVASVTEYGQTLYSKYAEYRENLTKCKPEEFDDLYDKYTQEYLDAGYQEIIDEKTQLYNDGLTTKLP